MCARAHGIIGEEAVPIGVCENLRDDDYVIPVHRTQMGAMIARGISLDRLTAELFGRRTGYCYGVAGTHLGCKEKGILGKTGILGAGLPVAVGVGLSIKMRKTNQVVVVFFGEGQSSVGNFHESLNMASIWKLPIIFVLENNMYSWSTPAKDVISIEKIALRAMGYNMPGVTIDGNDVITVYNTAKRAIKKGRQGLGPYLIECKTYRILDHFGPKINENDEYRSKKEIKLWKRRDPVKNFRKTLLKNKIITQEDVIKIESEVKKIVESAMIFALKSPYPSKEEVISLSIKRSV